MAVGKKKREYTKSPKKGYAVKTEPPRNPNRKLIQVGEHVVVRPKVRRRKR